MALMAGKATLPSAPAAMIASDAGMDRTHASATICAVVAARPAAGRPCSATNQAYGTASRQDTGSAVGVCERMCKTAPEPAVSGQRRGRLLCRSGHGCPAAACHSGARGAARRLRPHACVRQHRMRSAKHACVVRLKDSVRAPGRTKPQQADFAEPGEQAAQQQRVDHQPRGTHDHAQLHLRARRPGLRAHARMQCVRPASSAGVPSWNRPHAGSSVRVHTHAGPQSAARTGRAAGRGRCARKRARAPGPKSRNPASAAGTG